MEKGRTAFFNLVKEMRHAQNKYFMTRKYAALLEAQRLERKVDACIRRGDDYLSRRENQPGLFDETGSPPE